MTSHVLSNDELTAFLHDLAHEQTAQRATLMGMLGGIALTNPTVADATANALERAAAEYDDLGETDLAAKLRSMILPAE